MRAPAALLLASLALAGCGGAPKADKGAALQEQEAARAAELGKISGWERAFLPDAAVGAANQFGFHAPAFAASGTGFASKGGPIVIANSAAETPNVISFAATGTATDKVDTIAFDVTLAGTKGDADALKRTADLVRDYLFQSNIDARPVHDKIAGGEAQKGQFAGADYAIEKAADRLTVTFHRTGASAPANS